MDLDGFKRVNDQYGHKVGDDVLKMVAKALTDCCGSDCIAGRLGGDEFIVATINCSDAELNQLAGSILTAVARMTCAYGNITASIGISRYPQEARDFSHAKALADKAMYAAKKAGKNMYLFYPEIPLGGALNHHSQQS